MNFSALDKMLNDEKSIGTLALEANTTHSIDEGEFMNVSLITDKMIEANNIKEVSDPIYFKSGSEPTDEGLFSPLIFGETLKEKMKTHAYIDLHRKFFHPYVFEVMMKLYRNFDEIASGQGAWYINELGEVERITDSEDIRYDEDNTGLAWLIENFRKIHFKETDSDKRKAYIKLLNNLSDDEIFITKWIVIPVFYRDFDNSSGKKTIPPINDLYKSIISNTTSYDTELLSLSKHMTLYRIQKTMVEIRQLGQSLIEKKKGAFQKTILGKAPDHGSRGVISVPSLNGCDTPNDCLVDILHSGIPLSKCIEMGYPFIIKWVIEFFEDMFRNKKYVPVFKKDAKDKEQQVQFIKIADQTDVFTKDFIEKKMEMYIKTFGEERFETVKIVCEDGTEEEIYFDGKGYGISPDDPRANSISGRPLTWTDVFYLAAENTLSDKHVYITRYPLEDYFGIFPTRVAVLSTIKTVPVIINGKVYPHYPMINLNLSAKEIATQFIDTFSISNLYLEAIGGDYDGDTVSAKIVYSMEANQEAEELLNSIKHYVSIQGNLVRVVGNESYLTFYNMTRRE